MIWRKRGEKVDLHPTNEVSNRLERIEHRLGRVEAELRLLQMVLSIPDRPVEPLRAPPISFDRPRWFDRLVRS